MSATSMSDSNAPDVEHTNNEIMNVTDAQSDDVVMHDVELQNEQDMLVTAEHNQADGTALDPDATEPVVPERPYAPVSVVTERFLRAILAHIPIERIAELHLFSPLRQGGVETGIAVIAADVEVTEIDAVVPDVALELGLGDDEHSITDDTTEQHFTTHETTEQHFTAEDAEDPERSVESVDSESDVETVSVEGDNGDSVVEADLPVDDDSPYADDEVVTTSAESDSAADGSADDSTVDGAIIDTPSVVASADATGIPDAPQLPAAPVRHVRHTVYTARYRLVLKGPERGKWEADVVNEADAPLVAVETVVRGVQRRAGEATETVRYDAAQIAQALRMVTPS